MEWGGGVMEWGGGVMEWGGGVMEWGGGFMEWRRCYGVGRRHCVIVVVTQKNWGKFRNRAKLVHSK